MKLLCFALLQISIFSFFRLTHSASSTSFNFSSFQSNTAEIIFEGDAHISGNIIQLSKTNQSNISHFGRATYAQPVQIYDSTTGMLADFTHHCTFLIDGSPTINGFAAFLAPNGSTAPPNSTGGYLGLVNNSAIDSGYKFIAMEYDTFQNQWDPSNAHVAMNIDSIHSDQIANWNTTMTNKLGNAWLTYNGSTMLLSLYVTYVSNPAFNGETILTKTINLKDYLSEWVTIGFSAGTNTTNETQTIHSWEFYSSFNTPSTTNSSNKVGMVVGIVVGSVVLISGLSLFGYWFVYRKGKRGKEESDVVFELAMEEEFEKGAGPRRFSYHELVKATENFNVTRKLGEGGFGGVYKGFLSDLNMEVAVKRVSKGSRQGVKEYVSEIKVISRLRHRNLVQLVGWCHERGELLLVYEYMENGSLDFHIFRGTKMVLPWEIRYKIAHGLASALLYLHEEGEQCVVHRDIKSSNVMLDSSFNAKLGDFGLARLVDHQLGSQTTVIAGTMGYMAPECVTTGKASKESDVYSFGVVALEIACGRRAVEHREESSKVALVAWVWELYGSGRLLEAVDPALEMEYDEKQIERLMVVGLWCAYLDHILRPSIKQAINVLNFEAPMPNLPSKITLPSYISPLMNYVSSNDTTTTTDSSMPTMSSFASSTGSSTTFLYGNKKNNF
ncbi:L-type lectin-domain containing receptor kinase IX.1-like [Macadamia integrifolia]|uniref:L-type lectin-domain containing receptor kinase IX.1-like n=1 Tax=Macadamia integrifolia TaxID=60698 RepID=UPI001C4FE595|nr:L-type lectin-domain containing receptor kinase IX.1-like [Macadamia integrifolia]